MTFEEKVADLYARHEQLLNRANTIEPFGNGIYDRYKYPILTAAHTPLEWRYDFSEKDNPFLMQRIMINTVFNAGAIKLDGRYLLVCRVEAVKSEGFI